MPERIGPATIPCRRTLRLPRAGPTKRHHPLEIYVGNLPYSASRQDLKELLGPHVDVQRLDLITDRETGQSKGFAFVTVRASDADAILKLNGTDLDGRALRINEARGKVDRSNRQRFAEFTDLDGYMVSVATRDVIAIDQGTWTWTETAPNPKYREWKEQKAKEKAEYESLSLGQKAARNTILGVLHGAWGLLVAAVTKDLGEGIHAAVGPKEEPPSKFLDEKRVSPCTLIRTRVGSRVRTFKVKDPYDRVVKALDDP